MAQTNGQAPAGAQEQLDRVLSSDAFRNSPRLSEFLRFSVGAALRGEAGQVKEYLIGVEVFGRGPDYDPRVDPVVRVEARRLRAKLREYYEEEGRQDTLRILFPKGGYVPAFEIRDGEPGGAESRETATGRGELGSRRLLSRRSLGWSAAGGVAAAAAYWFGWRSGGPAAVTRIAVLPMRAYGPPDSGQAQHLADVVTEALLRELSRRQDLSVVSWPTAAGYDATGKDARQISRELDAGLVAAVWVQRDAETVAVSVHLVDSMKDRKVWGARYELPPETQGLPTDFAANVASELLQRLPTETVAQ